VRSSSTKVSQHAGLRGELAFDLKVRIVREQRPHVGLLEVQVRGFGKSRASERGLADLPRAEDERRRELPGDGPELFCVQAIPDAPCCGSVASRIKGSVSSPIASCVPRIRLDRGLPLGQPSRTSNQSMRSISDGDARFLTGPVHRLWALGLFALLAIGVQADADEAVYDRIDAFLSRRMREASIPGCAFVAVRDDAIVHFRGLGVAGPGRHPVGRATPFGIGSLSKSFGALAAMQLVGDGKLDLDAPVRRYVPEFRTRDADESGRITVRHLLHHQSGLPTYVRHADWEANHDPTEALHRAVRFMRTVRLENAPGTTFHYSDPGYVVLAAVIERVSGRTFERYLKDAIFRPLGMEHSHTSEIEAREDGAAVGYRSWFGRPVAHGGLSSCYFDPLSGGGLYCSAEDLARYLIAHLSLGRTAKAPLLSEEGFRRLQAPAVAIQGVGHYAMGWMVYTNLPEIPRLTGHAGRTPKYVAIAGMLPDHRLGFAVLFNAGVPDTLLRNAQTEVARMLLGLPQTNAPWTADPTDLLPHAVCLVVIMLLTALVLRSAWLLHQIRSKRSGDVVLSLGRMARWGLAMLLGVAVLSFVGLAPALFGTHAQAFLDYAPDLGCLLIVAGTVAAATISTHVWLLIAWVRHHPDPWKVIAPRVPRVGS